MTVAQMLGVTRGISEIVQDSEENDLLRRNG